MDSVGVISKTRFAFAGILIFRHGHGMLGAVAALRSK